jgi:predicted transcriptional regulator YheO
LLPVTEVVIHRIVDRKACVQIAGEHVGARAVVIAPEVT